MQTVKPFLEKKLLKAGLVVLLLSATGWMLDAQTVSTSLQKVNYNSNSLFCFNYPSIGLDGQPVVLSAMLAARDPQKAGGMEPVERVVAGCHITITSDFESPSGLKDTLIMSDCYMMANIPGTAAHQPLNRSIVIMPDYEGYGVTRDHIHPYLAQELTARQVTDAIRYGVELYRQLAAGGSYPPLAENWRTYCLGYSQGGAVALATQRYIEQAQLSGELHLAGSLCGDGPYDLIGTLRFYIEDDGDSYGVTTAHRRGRLSMPFVLAMIIKGMQDSHPDMKNHRLTDYFSKQFLDTGVFEWIEDKSKERRLQKTTGDIRRLFYEQAERGLTAADGTVYTAKQMQELIVQHSSKFSLTGRVYDVSIDVRKALREELLAYLEDESHYGNLPEEKGDPFIDLQRALYDNSLFHGWVPTHRVMLFHSKHDIVVPYVNCESFVQAMPQDMVNVRVFSQEDHLEAGTTFFMKITSTSYASNFNWIDQGPVSGLKTPPAAPADGRWYSPDGRSQTEPGDREGLYLRGGEKVLIRRH
ncbi:MAG: hypothetical protein ILP04_04305 [Bacteroidales bacterium]|nr:hypothetical protein [Bacteroidales bacterium]